MNRNSYRADHAPYYICALDYIQQSAGIRALHYLCHALNESGMEAYVTCQKISSSLRTPPLNESALQQHHFAGRKPIVIYPEIITGDPLGAGGVVVRWLLNQPGHIAGEADFPASDIIFAYADNYLPADRPGEILHIPTCDTAIFNNENNPHDGQRDLVCYYAHKYLSKGGRIDDHLKSSVSLCKDQPLTHAEIAATLRRAKVLYVYEPTAMITEALLCGCPVSVVVTDYWKTNTANLSYPADWGIIMDDQPASLQLAATNIHKFGEIYRNTVIHDAWVHLDRFIDITQAAAR